METQYANAHELMFLWTNLYTAVYDFKLVQLETSTKATIKSKAHSEQSHQLVSQEFLRK